jgi:hypothetical protein
MTVDDPTQTFAFRPEVLPGADGPTVPRGCP